ncbi:UNVERIFIED_CONTAM: hypothetical protein RMT77_000076 [Armadillidium vulgare]
MSENNPVELSSDDRCLLINLEGSHYPLNVVIPLYGVLILLISLLTGGFLLPVFYQNETFYSTDTFSSVIYFHIIVWVFITLLTWFVKAEHKTSRILGYHEFYDSTRHLHRVPFYLLSGGNVLMLIVSCVTHNFCLGGGVSPCSDHISLTPVNYLQILICIEVAIGLPLLTKHIVEVYRFNQKRLPPDVFRGYAPHLLDNSDVIVGTSGRVNVERILSQQADQLMTLNHRNELLCQQLHTLIQRQEVEV